MKENYCRIKFDYLCEAFPYESCKYCKIEPDTNFCKYLGGYTGFFKCLNEQAKIDCKLKKFEEDKK